MAKAYVLSERDKAVLKETVNEVRRALMNAPGRSKGEPRDGETEPAPEIYVALTPPDGIPGMHVPNGEGGTGSAAPARSAGVSPATQSVQRIMQQQHHRHRIGSLSRVHCTPLWAIIVGSATL